MTLNLMEEYLNITNNYIIKYMKLVMKNKYNTELGNRLITKYIDTRYNNYYEDEVEKGLSIRKRIMTEIRDKANKFVEGEIVDKNTADNMCIFFFYILYFDNLILTKNIEKKIENIQKLRKKLLNIDEEDFINNLKELINNWKKEKINLLDKFDTKEFELKITSYKNNPNVYRVNLKQYIKFPLIYSELAINKVWNTGIINEDKLYIEYYLITVKIIKEIVKQNFKKQYILEFATTLLEKEKKIKGIINIINNLAIQEKISLKIKYSDYLKYKQNIYDLMRMGFKIAIILDNSFEVNNENLGKLNMFSYVLINKVSEVYDKISNFSLENSNENVVKSIKNLIEI